MIQYEQQKKVLRRFVTEVIMISRSKIPAVDRFSIWSTHEFMEEKLNVRTSSDLPIDQPWKGGKSQTAQGERSVTLGIEYWITLLYDSLRVEDVPQELDSSWRQWCFRKIIALTNMSFRTGTPYPSMPVLGNVVLMPYPQGYASLTLGCLTLAALSGLVYR